MQEDQEKATELIMEAARLLGWELIFDSESEDIDYIILVKPESADGLLDKLEK